MEKENGRKKSRRGTSGRRDEESQSVCGARAYLGKTGAPQIRPRINELERGIVVGGGNDDDGGGQDKEQRKRNGRREREKERKREKESYSLIKN